MSDGQVNNLHFNLMTVVEEFISIHVGHVIYTVNFWNRHNYNKAQSETASLHGVAKKIRNKTGIYSFLTHRTHHY